MIVKATWPTWPRARGRQFSPQRRFGPGIRFEKLGRTEIQLSERGGGAQHGRAARPVDSRRSCNVLVMQRDAVIQRDLAMQRDVEMTEPAVSSDHPSGP